MEKFYAFAGVIIVVCFLVFAITAVSRAPAGELFPIHDKQMNKAIATGIVCVENGYNADECVETCKKRFAARSKFTEDTGFHSDMLIYCEMASEDAFAEKVSRENDQ